MTDPTPFEDTGSFQAAVESARRAAAAYYDGSAPLMTDSAYDELADRIEAAKRLHPDWDDHGIVSQVAAGASAGGEVRHPTAMLSLSKVKTEPEIVSWLAGLGDEQVVLEPKLDGIAARAVYAAGQLTLVATRGDGSTGENITHRAIRLTGIASLPTRLAWPFTGEVRGEVFMTDANFDAANAARVAAGKPAFSNPRNATAGAIRNEDLTYDVPMTFAVYDIDSADPLPSSHTERMGYATRIGFQPALHLVDDLDFVDPLPSSHTVLSRIEAVHRARPTLGFPIDGAVVKVDSYPARQRIGTGNRAPRWAVAWKYPPDTAITTIRAVEVTVGRTGRLGFRFVVDPTFVAGSEISYVTAHNAPWIASADIRINDRVWLYKAGDVIPRVTTVILEDRLPDSQPWQAPDHCPQCGEPLDKTSLLWRCHTPSCSQAAALAYWCSRDCLDVDSVGDTICEALVNAKLAENVADLYDLTVDKLAALPLGVSATGTTRVLGPVVAKKIVANLEASRQQPFNRVVTGLGIRLTGRSVSRWITSRFQTMEALRAATVEDVSAIEGLGDIKAQAIVDGLAHLGPVIDRLTGHGLAMAVAGSGGHKPFAGQTYVISGSIPGFSRTEAHEAIERLGGKASGAVSKNTAALVTSETSTSKAVKAAQLGVPVIDPTDFAEILNHPHGA